MFFGRKKRNQTTKRNFLLGGEQLEERSLLAADLAGREYAPGEILVQFAPTATAAQRASVRSAVGGQLAETIHTPTMKAVGAGALERIKIPNGLAIDKAIAAFARQPRVQFAEPNYVYRPSVDSNDTYYTSGSLWGMYGSDSPTAAGPGGTTNQFGIDAERAWKDNITGSKNVVVGIIDEGIQITHPDLAGNIWTNPGETAGDGIDNDGNGYIDDVNGWDFYYDNNSVYDAGGDAHGTHVAGTIGGIGGNGIGVAGVNWNVSMISAKFLGPQGGYTSDAVAAVDYLTGLKAKGVNLVASNNSWGGGGYSQALHNAIIRGAKSDILFIAAAGNASANNDTTASYPSNYNTSVGTSTESAASYDSVIAVASITNTGAMSSFSSYGATNVDIGAPGSGIWSSVPSNSYASYNGTSMATPHVTGAAALFASMYPAGGTSAASIKAALLESATPTASLAGKTVTGGRLNVYSALQRATSIRMDKPAYGAPSTITVSVRNLAANLNVEASETVTAALSSTTETTPEVITLTETGLNTGVFVGTIATASGAAVADGTLQVANDDQISAYNAGINKTATASADTVAPTISSLTSTPRTTSADIQWNTNEASTTEVLYGTSSNALTDTYSNATLVTSHTAVLTGLSPGTTYYYKVRSRDAAGNASESSEFSLTTLMPTKFFVVDDGPTDRTFEYTASGDAVTNYALANTAPRGAAMTSPGDKVWVVDANRRVYVYNNTGGLLGSWTAGSLSNTAAVEGIATDGTHIWIVDSVSDKVFYYANAASRLSGNTKATSSWTLGSGNTNPKDVVFGWDGSTRCLWVVNEGGTSLDKVFRYVLNTNGSIVTSTTGTTQMVSWNLAAANASPTGITLDPSQTSGSLWVVDSGTDTISEYTSARGTSAGVLSATSYKLSATNTNPQGIADPPPSGAQANTASVAALLPTASVALSQPVPRRDQSGTLGSPVSSKPAVVPAADARGGRWDARTLQQASSGLDSVLDLLARDARRKRAETGRAGDAAQAADAVFGEARK